MRLITQFSLCVFSIVTYLEYVVSDETTLVSFIPLSNVVVPGCAGGRWGGKDSEEWEHTESIDRKVINGVFGVLAISLELL